MVAAAAANLFAAVEVVDIGQSRIRPMARRLTAVPAEQAAIEIGPNLIRLTIVANYPQEAVAAPELSAAVRQVASRAPSPR